MTKQQLIEQFADYANLSKAEAGRQVEWIFNTIMQGAIDNADGAVLPGLGKLKVKETKAREGVIQLGENKGAKWSKPASKKFSVQISKSGKDFLAG